jgi:hypothetical protein
MLILSEFKGALLQDKEVHKEGIYLSGQVPK